MATVAVTADNTRIAVATIATDTGTWGNDGGGGGVADEADIVYQTTTAQSRKVGATAIGRSYTHGSGTDMDGTPASTAHYIAKIAATNYNILNVRSTPALHMKIGSSASDHHWYYLFGSDNYPPRGGWQIVAIAPSVTGYQDGTDVGTPNDSSVLYWSLLGDFTTTSKAENVVIDAIDVGLGLGLVAGDGASTDGVFADFVAYDEGTASNRFGYCFTQGQVLFFTGEIRIGQTGSTQTSTITTFNDSGVTCVWQNGLVTTGFHRFLLDIATTGTTITLANCSLLSEGQVDNDGDRGYTTTEDSRPIFEVTGTAGTVQLTGCVINNFASFALNSDVTFTGCTITNSGQLDAGTGADLAGTSILLSTVAADTGALLWNNALDPDGELDGMSLSKGTAAHHAIDFGTSVTGDITLRNIEFTGFGTTEDGNDAALRFLATTGSLTCSLIGCTVGGAAASSTNLFKDDAAGIAVTLSFDPVTTQVHIQTEALVDLQNARVILQASDGTGDLPFEDTVTISQAAGVATVVHTGHGMPDGNKVVIKGATNGVDQYNGVKTITFVSANSYTYTLDSGTPSPATGTITATGVVLEGLTDANGKISDQRTWTTSQPVIGKAAKASASPYYAATALSGTISPTLGLGVHRALRLDGTKDS